MAAVGGGEMHVDHLEGREFFENGSRRQAGGQLPGLELEGDVQTVSDEGDEDVGLDALVELMVNGPEAEVAFQFLEGLLDIPLIMPLYD